jgi:uncharacterized membrane protein
VSSTETKSNQNLMGALAYLLGPITGVVLLLTQKDSTVRFHSMQSIVVLGGLWLLSWILPFTVVGIVLVLPLMIVTFVLWVLLMWKAFNGEKFKVPYLGDFAEKQLSKIK